MKTLSLIITAFVLLFLTGCPKGQSSTKYQYLAGQPNRSCPIVGKWSSSPVVYIAPSVALDGTDLTSVIREELDRIDKATDVSFTYTDDPNLATIRISTFYDAAWTTSAVHEDEDSYSGAPRPLGTTEYKRRGNDEIIGATIKLNHFIWYTGNNKGESYPKHFRTMVRHEFGHAMGLWHNTEEPNGVMAARVSQADTKVVFSVKETEILNWLY